MRRFLPLIILFIVIMQSALTASASVVSGDAFRWDTLEELPDTIIRIYQDNNLINQVRCDENGAYSVNLTPGRYHVTAVTIKNGSVTYVSELNVTISDSGARIDIPMFPPFEELFPDVEEFVSIYDQIEILSAINESEYETGSAYTLDTDIEEVSILKRYNYIVIPLVLFIAVVLLTGYFLRVASGMDKKATSGGRDGGDDIPESDVVAEIVQDDIAQDNIVPAWPAQDTEELSDDERTIIMLLEDAGGSVQQKQIVREMECSPAKVSLLLKGLEEKGLVKKQTIGRTKLIKLL